MNRTEWNRASSGVACLIATVLLGGCSHAERLPRIVYIDSYRQEGTGSSDEVLAGLGDVLLSRGAELRVVFFDVGASARDAEVRAAVESAERAIRDFRPDAIVASGDAALKHVVVPFHRGGPTPVVFCGVGWSAEPYGLPSRHVTGIVEVPPIVETVEALRRGGLDVRRVLVLSEDSIPEARNRRYLEPLLREHGIVPTFSALSAFDDWKREVSSYGGARTDPLVDLIFLGRSGAVRGWDDAEARRVIRESVRVPTVACEETMVGHAAFGLTAVTREQGEWAARTALDIAAGRSPADIPVARNREIVPWLDQELAEKVGLRLPPDVLARCRIVGTGTPATDRQRRR